MSTNAPESDALTRDDIAIFENARQQIAVLRRTFDCWVVIGRAVIRAREIANRRGGGKTFMRLLDQQGITPALGRSPKTMASKLLKIMERYTEIVAWRETLTVHQQIEWSAPSTVLAQCPIFAKGNRKQGRIKPDTKLPPDTLKRQVEQLQARVRELHEELEAARGALTVDEHFSALIDLLRDEPQHALQDAVNGFCRDVKRVWDARRKAKKPLRETTSKEADDKAAQKVLHHAVRNIFRSPVLNKRKAKARLIE